MKKVFKNYIYNIIYQVISLLTPLITAPYISRTLGAENVGISNFSYSIVYWFILIGMLGIRIYGNKEIAKCGDDKKKRSKTFCEIFALQFTSLFISLLLYYIYFATFPVEYKTVFLIYGVTIMAIGFDISWFYCGIEDFKQIMLRDLLVKVLNIAAMLIFIKSTDDLILYVIFVNAFFLVSQLVMWMSLKKHVNLIKIKLSDIKKHIKPNILLFIPQIAASIYSMLDQTMIGLISTNIEDVAYYGYAQKFVHMFLFVTTSIGTVMLPRIARTNAIEGKEKVKEYIRKTFSISLFLSIPMAFGLASISPYIIPWLLTDSFKDTGYLIVILSPLMIFLSLTNVLAFQYLIPLDRTKEYTVSVTIGCILNFILNLILIPKYSGYGAAFASIVAEATVFAVQFYYVRKESLLINIRKKAILYFLASMLMEICMIGIGYVRGIGIVTALIQFITGCAIYFLVLYLFKDEVELKFISIIKAKLKRR